MNACNKRFLERNGISIEQVCSSVDCNIHSRMEENPIVASYNFQTEEQIERISVADIIGYEANNKGGKNIFFSMDYFFDDDASGYRGRSVGMLEYNENNILEQLKYSFEREPISLIETGEGHYNVYYNGFHRYTLLRILYLNEVSKAKGDKEELAWLRKKYTIPAKVIGVDLDKTYCKYFLTKAKCGEEEWDIIDICTHYNSENQQTENCVIKYGSGKEEVLTNEQLRDLTRERVAEDVDFIKRNPQIQQAYNRYPSFRDFVDVELAGIFTLELQNTEEKGEH